VQGGSSHKNYLDLVEKNSREITRILEEGGVVKVVTSYYMGDDTEVFLFRHHHPSTITYLEMILESTPELVIRGIV
jgi:hypothetical protein